LVPISSETMRTLDDMARLCMLQTLNLDPVRLHLGEIVNRLFLRKTRISLKIRIIRAILVNEG
jgi:hypothetical protein